MIVRALVLAVLAAGLAGSVLSLRRASGDVVPLELLLGPWAWVLLASAAAAIPLSAAAAVRAVRGKSWARGLWPLRAAFVWLVLGAVSLIALAHPFERAWVELTPGPVTAAYALTLLFGGRHDGKETPRLRALDFALFNLCLSLVFAEIGLRIYSRVSPSPLLVRPGLNAQDFLNDLSPSPGDLRLGFPTNSHGCYDEEFTPAPPGVHVVATLGDSFSQGIVPHPFHYTTVAEGQLDGVRVDNYGFASIGPLEYQRLLRSTVQPAGPDLVVLSLFAGNDLRVIRSGAVGRPQRHMRAWLDRDNVLVYQVFRRLARGASLESHSRGDKNRLTRLEEFTARFPWIADPMLETPSFGVDTFYDIEVDRALDISGGRVQAYRQVFKLLLEMRDLCGETPFAVMIIPDELQVEDAVWEGVLERVPEGSALERDLAQRRLGQFFEEEGIPYLDLLPALRAVEPLEDGRRHLYHLRDTHFNTRGNRIAGEALAHFIAELLALDGSG